MGKMFNTLLLSGLVSIVLLLFDGTGALSIIGQLFLGPQTGWGTFFSDALTSALGISTGASLIVIGTGALLKQDWLLRLGLFTVLVSWVESPFIQLWQFIGSKILTDTPCIGEGCALVTNGATSGGMIVAGLICGPLVLYALWSCFQYIWGDF